MTLKKTVKNNDSEKMKKLMEEIDNLKTDISTLINLKEQKKRELLELQIKPFKIGGYAIAEIPSGRNRKEQKCLIECECGILYVRPVKEDGSLSGRHFSIYPLRDKTYADYLKEVEE